MSTAHTDDDAEQYRRIRAGDIAARNAMAERHFGLVNKVATYYAKRNPLLDMDDMLQEGRIGIISALERYDVDSGYRFSTYAMHWIKHYIQRYVVSNHSRAASTGKKDTEAYIADRMSPSDAALYEQRCISHHSIEFRVDGRSASETIPSDCAPLEDQADSSIRWGVAREALFDKSITASQRIVICMRYGLLGYRPHTRAQIAEEMNISQQAVGAAERAGLAKMRVVMDVDE